MSLRIHLKHAVILLCLVLMLPLSSTAERIKLLNPECVVCPVVIAYEGDEAAEILGKDIALQMMKPGAVRQRTLKIDLDGIRKPGSEKDPDTGFELLVYVYPHMIAVNCIRGSGTLKLITDYRTLASSNGDIRDWNPGIELMPSGGYEIDREDDLETAWDKIRQSDLYRYINADMNHDLWNERLRRFLMNVLVLAAQ